LNIQRRRFDHITDSDINLDRDGCIIQRRRKFYARPMVFGGVPDLFTLQAIGEEYNPVVNILNRADFPNTLNEEFFLTISGAKSRSRVGRYGDLLHRTNSIAPFNTKRERCGDLLSL
jgi:hypothetical protein